MATSSGMPVIFTRSAFHTPMHAPMAMVPRMMAMVPSATCSLCATATTMVATSASAMPIMPSTLPRCAVFCFERPASARMNSSAAKI